MAMWFLVMAIIIILFILKSKISGIIIPVTYSSSNKNVPRIIHQTAPSDEKKWNPVWKLCQESWKRNFPQWEYKMWTDEDLDTLIRTKYAWFYTIYSNYPKKIMRIDAARYFILYDQGGIYADMDFECVKNFEHVIPQGLAFAAETPFGTFGEVYQNALMGSPEKHEFWIRVFEDLVDHSKEPDVLQATGPEVIHRVADANPDLFQSLQSKNFAPSVDDEESTVAIITLEKRNENVMKRFYKPADPHVYTRHHGSCQWCDSM